MLPLALALIARKSTGDKVALPNEGWNCGLVARCPGNGMNCVPGFAELVSSTTLRLCSQRIAPESNGAGRDGTGGGPDNSGVVGWGWLTFGCETGGVESCWLVGRLGIGRGPLGLWLVGAVLDGGATNS